MEITLKQTTTMVSEEIRDQFMRIAMSTLKKKYPFKPQRRAYAAKLFMKYLSKYKYI